MNDATRRGLRTLFQVGTVAAVVTLGLEFRLIDWTTTQVAAVIAVLTPLLAFVQNYLEDHTSMPAVLKSPASVGQNPQPNPHYDMEPHG